MYKAEELVDPVGVVHPRMRVERLQEQASNIQRKLEKAQRLNRDGRGISPSRFQSLEFQLNRIMEKLSVFFSQPAHT